MKTDVSISVHNTLQNAVQFNAIGGADFFPQTDSTCSVTSGKFLQTD